jgi:hypothetical protein
MLLVGRFFHQVSRLASWTRSWTLHCDLQELTESRIDERWLIRKLHTWNTSEKEVHLQKTGIDIPLQSWNMACWKNWFSKGKSTIQSIPIYTLYKTTSTLQVPIEIGSSAVISIQNYQCSWNA